jgi:hypothetical protein
MNADLAYIETKLAEFDSTQDLDVKQSVLGDIQSAYENYESKQRELPATDSGWVAHTYQVPEIGDVVTTIKTDIDAINNNNVGTAVLSAQNEVDTLLEQQQPESTDWVRFSGAFDFLNHSGILNHLTIIPKPSNDPDNHQIRVCLPTKPRYLYAPDYYFFKITDAGTIQYAVPESIYQSLYFSVVAGEGDVKVSHEIGTKRTLSYTRMLQQPTIVNRGIIEEFAHLTTDTVYMYYDKASGPQSGVYETTDELGFIIDYIDEGQIHIGICADVDEEKEFRPFLIEKEPNLLGYSIHPRFNIVYVVIAVGPTSENATIYDYGADGQGQYPEYVFNLYRPGVTKSENLALPENDGTDNDRKLADRLIELVNQYGNTFNEFWDTFEDSRIPIPSTTATLIPDIYITTDNVLDEVALASFVIKNHPDIIGFGVDTTNTEKKTYYTIPKSVYPHEHKIEGDLPGYTLYLHKSRVSIAAFEWSSQWDVFEDTTVTGSDLLVDQTYDGDLAKLQEYVINTYHDKFLAIVVHGSQTYSIKSWGIFHGGQHSWFDYIPNKEQQEGSTLYAYKPNKVFARVQKALSFNTIPLDTLDPGFESTNYIQTVQGTPMKVIQGDVPFGYKYRFPGAVSGKVEEGIYHLVAGESGIWEILASALGPITDLANLVFSTSLPYRGSYRFGIAAEDTSVKLPLDIIIQVKLHENDTKTILNQSEKYLLVPGDAESIEATSIDNHEYVYYADTNNTDLKKVQVKKGETIARPADLVWYRPIPDSLL